MEKVHAILFVLVFVIATLGAIFGIWAFIKEGEDNKCTPGDPTITSTDAGEKTFDRIEAESVRSEFVEAESVRSEFVDVDELLIHSLSGKSPIVINDDMILQNKSITGVSTLESTDVKVTGFILTNQTSFTVDQELVSKKFVDDNLIPLNQKTSKLTTTGDITGSILTNQTSFTADQELVTKKFVDDSLIPLDQKTSKLTNTGDVIGSILTNQTSFTADQELVSKKFVDDSLIPINQKIQYQSATGTNTDFSSFVRYNGFVYDAPTALNHLTPKVYVDNEINKIPVFDQSLNTTDGVKFTYVDTPILYNNNASGTVYIGGDRIRLGEDAGASNQTSKAVAIGFEAGYANQGLQSVAIGPNSGRTNQTTLATAVGTNAGWRNQGLSSVAIGNEAGSDGQGSYCVAIGAFAGQRNQPNNSIIINANNGNILNPTTTGFFVKPLRKRCRKENMYYNPFTGEISYNIRLFLTIYDDTITAQTRSLGQGYLHKKVGDEKLYWLPDVSNAEIDLTHQTLYTRLSDVEARLAALEALN